MSREPVASLELLPYIMSILLNEKEVSVPSNETKPISLSSFVLAQMTTGALYIMLSKSVAK